MSLIVQINNYLKTYGLFKGFSIVIKRKLNSLKSKKELKTITPYIDQQFSYLLKNYEKSNENQQTVKNIFFLWWQGKEKMPYICQMCYKQIKHLYPDYRIIFIDKNNFNKYIKIDDNLINKFESGMISIQTFSDIIRFNLIYSLGGVWIDSTLFLPQRIDFEKYINKYSFFSLNTKNVNDFFSYCNFSSSWTSFLIGGPKGSNLFKAIVELYVNFFLIQNNNKKAPYFLIDIFIMLCKKYHVSNNAIDNFSNEVIFNNYDFMFLINNLNSKNIDYKILYKYGPQKLNWRINIEKFNKKSLILRINSEVENICF